MMQKVFSIRPTRSRDSKLACRLELEALEDRVSPALVVGGVPPGQYVSGGSLNGVPGATSIQGRNEFF